MTFEFKSQTRRFLKFILGQRLIDRLVGMPELFRRTRTYWVVSSGKNVIGMLLPIPWHRCGWKIKRQASLSDLREESAGTDLKVVELRAEKAVELKAPQHLSRRDGVEVFLPLVQKSDPRFDLIKVPGGYAYDDGKNITILDSGGLLIDGATTDRKWPCGKFGIQLRGRLPKVRSLSGRTLYLSTWGARGNYYHWMMELLPKLFGVADAGVAIADYDHIVVNAMAQSYQRETLERWREKVVCSGEPGNEFLKCEELETPSHACNIIPSGWALDLLRTNLVPPIRHEPKRKLYVSRADASYRYITNEAEVFTFLEEVGFESVTLTGMSVAEQAMLFSSACVIVCAHGAALTNLAFCDRGCRVLEIFAAGYVKPFYWGISATLGLDYSCLVARRPKGQESRTVTADLVVDIEKLEECIAPWGM